MGAHDCEQHEERKKNSSKRRRPSFPCELCKQRASVYCPCDEARLCDSCDAKVHGANFLVARHSRHVLCFCCGAPALSPHTGVRIESDRLQEPCVQCALLVLHGSESQISVDALSSPESCCIDIDEDRSSSVSRSHTLFPTSCVSPSHSLGRSSSVSRSTTAAMRSVRTPKPDSTAQIQEEGLGDSEDCSYGLPFLRNSPSKRRRPRH